MNFDINWTKETYQEFLNYLSSLQDKKYQEFHGKIIECDNLIGVKTLELKKIAKEISKNNYLEFFKVNTSTLYETIMIEGFILGYLKLDFETFKNYLNEYLKKVNNWAHVDLMVTNLKILKKSPPEGFKFAKTLTHSKNNWAKRCGIVILLSYYLHDIYLEKTLEVVSKVKSEDYYVNMAIAWLLSISYIKYKETTLIYIVNLKNNFVYNKTLTKITESRRISEDEKNFIKSLKRREDSKEKIGA